MKLKNSYLILIYCLVGVSCSLESDILSFNKAEEAYQQKLFKKSVRNYENVIKLDPRSKRAIISAKKAVRILHFDLLDFEKATQLYEYLILNSKEKEEVRVYQTHIASIFYDKLQNYNRSINEFNKLLKIEKNTDVQNDIRLKIVKSYFNLNKFYQAQIEIEKLLKQKIPDTFRFQVLNYRANIHLTTKEYQKASVILKKLLSDFPNEKERQNIGISLALCYEELEDLDQSIEILNGIKEDYASPDFIELKIKRLMERKKNLPGARGFLR
ncbi:MAG: hypothetical protein HOO06_00750 [Bdellovibrionaceae bacterium]|jgi:tetratricopeptide (TPR) repeat protein|nr:hypothetical protein [Pseudobdellovibrionaceae bacterium]